MKGELRRGRDENVSTEKKRREEKKEKRKKSESEDRDLLALLYLCRSLSFDPSFPLAAFLPPVSTQRMANTVRFVGATTQVQLTN